MRPYKADILKTKAAIPDNEDIIALRVIFLHNSARRIAAAKRKRHE